MKCRLSLIILPIILMSVYSCKKSNPGTTNGDSTATQNQKVKLLTSLTYTSTNNPSATIPVNTYKYDDKHRLIEVASATTDEKITYDNNDRVIQTDSYSYNFPYSTYKYTYQTGSITETGVLYSNNVPGTSFTILLTLDNNQRVVKTSSNTSPSNFYTYDSQGNILSTGQGTTVDYNYTYDNHKNPFVNVKGNSFFFLEQWSVAFGYLNNIVTVSVPGDSNPSVLTYTFDQDGYPITQTETLSTTITRIYKYTYSLL